MNDIKKIIISNGWEPDQNNALAEVVIPSTIKTLNAPRKVTFMGQILNYIPSTVAALQEFEAPVITAISNTQFSGYTGLKSVKMQSLTSLTRSEFKGCTGLISANFAALTSLIVDNGPSNGAFHSCTSLTLVYLPLCSNFNITGGYSGGFYNCTALKTIELPSFSVSSVNTSGSSGQSGLFINCTSLENVSLGSEGHAVVALASTTFMNCNQSGLTITVYTADGNPISGSPWGATNATIIWEEA